MQGKSVTPRLKNSHQTAASELRENVGGSISDLRSKKKASSNSLAHGGSLMHLGNKQIGIKKIASSGNLKWTCSCFFYLLSFLVGHKLDKVGGKAKKSLSSLKLVSKLLYV